ncbi:MAG: 1-(5-phosphoribosyl)-5-[(5-phosphoribosylamino)methylideneamino]imidazole-4-carboxamide isomerase [Pirellulaceae bacterium]|nr:1-(5-phosphoribosyl)-5-[(5-phosphoribosylamino)methylideneamino]imidazole-4-carboxamide isomerase [Planctomycetales bacterium]
MQIWPAIDLRGGNCVRLRQGDYGRETVFDTDPVSVARQFAEAGAGHLHLVDLDGAREGRVVNGEVIAEVVRAVPMVCELGGGIRDEDSIRQLLELGLSRLVIGTRALKDSEWFAAMCHAFPGKLVLGLDARGGRVATDGWLETSDRSACEIAVELSQLPMAAIIYTDIATDGMMAGPNVAEMQQMQAAVDLPVVASGGVTTVSDVIQLAAIPMAGAIIGRALYEGKITIEEAIAASN